MGRAGEKSEGSARSGESRFFQRPTAPRGALAHWPDLRPIVRAAMSGKRSAAASRRLLPVRSERDGALPISRPGLPGRAAQCDRDRMAETRSSGFGGAAAGQSKAATGCGGIEHAPIGMRSISILRGRYRRFHMASRPAPQISPINVDGNIGPGISCDRIDLR